MSFALVLGRRTDFRGLGDLGAVGDFGRTALVGLIGGNLGFRAFTSHADVETAVACSKQIIQRVRYTESFQTKMYGRKKDRKRERKKRDIEKEREREREKEKKRVGQKKLASLRLIDLFLYESMRIG